MASVTLKSSDTFPVGTAVAAYPVVNWPQEAVPPVGAPRGASVASGVIAADGSVTLAGLTDDVRYFLAGQVAGVWRYVQFSAAVPSVVAKYAMAGTFTKAQAITPDSDVVPLTLRSGGVGAADQLVIKDQAGVDVFKVEPGTGRGRLSFPGTGTGHGPMGASVGGKTFGGTFDPVAGLGYNTSIGLEGSASRIVPGEPRAALVFEGDYNDGVSRDVEIYYEFETSTGLSVRPQFLKLKRDAATAADLIGIHELRMGDQLDVKSADDVRTYLRVQKVTINSAITGQLAIGHNSPAAEASIHAKTAGNAIINLESSQPSTGLRWRLISEGATGDFAMSTPTTEVFRVTGAGKITGPTILGIGTAPNAEAQLHVAKTGNAIINLASLDAGGTRWRFIAASGSGGDFVLSTPTIETLRITAAGVVKVPGEFQHTGTKVGFYNVATVARQTVLAAATDPATTQALVNDLRSKLITLGLVQ